MKEVALGGLENAVELLLVLVVAEGTVLVGVVLVLEVGARLVPVLLVGRLVVVVDVAVVRVVVLLVLPVDRDVLGMRLGRTDRDAYLAMSAGEHCSLSSGPTYLGQCKWMVSDAVILGNQALPWISYVDHRVKGGFE